MSCSILLLADAQLSECNICTVPTLCLVGPKEPHLFLSQLASLSWAFFRPASSTKSVEGSMRSCIAFTLPENSVRS